MWVSPTIASTEAGGIVLAHSRSSPIVELHGTEPAPLGAYVSAQIIPSAIAMKQGAGQIICLTCNVNPRDPRGPDHSHAGIFVYQNCWKCGSGEKPCAVGNPNQCEFPVARNH